MKDDIQQIEVHAFIVSSSPEPHQQRRQEILEKYPEVRRLFGREYKTKYLVCILCVTQFLLAYYVQRLNWFYWAMLLYFVGATLNHSIYTAIHELTHHLAFKSKTTSRTFAILVNLLLVIPMAMSFEKYHFMHHRFMGDETKDVDIPLPLEAKLFSSRKGKLIWLLIQPLTYGIRPLIKYPHSLNAWEWGNITLQLLFNIIVVLIFGWGFLLFLILSSLIAMSIHPTAGHAIAEHYIVSGQQETYSYYGLLNYVLFNVGHHVEHHDFPNIPWSRIHKLKKIAPEYYQTLYVHKSWVRLMYNFIASKKIQLYSRIIRENNR